MPSLRLLSVDARAVGGGRAGLAAVITAAEPELVCVHGAAHLIRWRQAAADLARRSGRVVVGGGGRQSGANLLLCTLGVDSGVTRDVRFPSERRLAPPGATLAAMRAHGTDFLLIGATLLGNSAERLGQAGFFQEAVDRFVPGDVPAVVSAEGADRPGTAAWQSLLENRVAVGGRVFVDARIEIRDSREIKGGTPARPALLVELGL